MNWIDIVLIVVLLVPTAIGFKVGLTKMVAPLIGLFLGVVFGSTLHGLLADQLDFIESDAWAHIVAFAIVFITIFAGIYVLAVVLRKILELAFLGLADRVAGAAIVFLTIWLITSFIVVMVAKYGALGADYVPGDRVNSETVTSRIEGSALAKAQIESVPVILGLITNEFDVVRDEF